MLLENLKNFFAKLFTGEFSKRSKILASLSIGWIIIVGYLTWWNGIKNPGIDKSFRWDEWFWFGVIPAIVPYLFYFIWVSRKREDIDNKNIK